MVSMVIIDIFVQKYVEDECFEPSIVFLEKPKMAGGMATF